MESTNPKNQYRAGGFAKLKRVLPVALTPVEARNYARTLTTLMDDRDRKRRELKSYNSLKREELQNLTGEIERYRRMVATETEDREVEVEERFDFPSKKVSIVRLDTGEIIAERPMTDAELQLPLKFDASPADAAPKPPPAAETKTSKKPDHSHLPKARPS